MSRGDILGVPLEQFEEPIQAALQVISDGTEGRVVFNDSPAASILNLTPDKPNSARSQTTFQHLGETVGNLFVIAFKPGDGTGDETDHKLSEVWVDTQQYPRLPRVVPRSKRTAHRECYLPLVAIRAEDSHADMASLTGSLHLLSFGGLDNSFPNQVSRIGTLGDDLEYFERLITGPHKTKVPRNASTVWYKHTGSNFKRMGDPHAVYNAHPEAIQVCGFVAIGHEHARAHDNLAHHLRAYPPIPR